VNERRWALAVLAGAALVLAACSSSPSKPAGSTSTTTTVAHHASSTTSTTAAPASSTTTSAAATSCSIKGASGQGQGAAGTITGTIVVTNVGSAPCTVNGYPTMALTSGSGAPLTVTIVDGLTVSISPPANAGPSSVTIPANGTAQFAYQYSDVPTGAETSCPSSEAASVTLPNGAGTSAGFAFTASPCDNGTIHVSPVYAGA
jgi:hypothetical protein